LRRNFTILSLVLLLSSCQRIQVENYYLPQDFEGNVAIIYKSGGNKTSDPQNWYIPKDGILKTDYKFSSGNVVTNYYQKNSSNAYDTLRHDFTTKDTTKNEIVFPRILTFSKPDTKEVFTVNTFYVGKRKVEEFAKDRYFFERKLEKMLLER